MVQEKEDLLDSDVAKISRIEDLIRPLFIDFFNN